MGEPRRLRTPTLYNTFELRCAVTETYVHLRRTHYRRTAPMNCLSRSTRVTGTDAWTGMDLKAHCEKRIKVIKLLYNHGFASTRMSFLSGWTRGRTTPVTGRWHKWWWSMTGRELRANPKVRLSGSDGSRSFFRRPSFGTFPIDNRADRKLMGDIN